MTAFAPAQRQNIDIDLDGMPTPDNAEVTSWAVRDILDDLRWGHDADVVIGLGIVRELAGYDYTAELARRLGSHYRKAGQRWMTETGAPDHSVCSDAYCYAENASVCPHRWMDAT